MPASSIPTVRRRRLGGELRTMREHAGMTLEDAGRRLGWDGSKISRLETGKSIAKPADLSALLDLYGIDDDQKRRALESLARDGAKRGWWQTYRDVLTPVYADFISLEADASEERFFYLAVVPGLLQTADYARAVVEETRPTRDQRRVNALVEIRMARQAALTRPEPLEVWVIVHEAVIRQRIGGARVMRDQLRRLVELTALPNLTLQVLPLAVGAHPGLSGSFTILRFPEPNGPDVVLLENLTSSLYIEHDDEANAYSTAFDRLRALALPFDESRQLIADAAKELE